MGAEFRLVRPDGGPLDISEDELRGRQVLGVTVRFEGKLPGAPRAIHIEALDGFESAGVAAARALSESLALTAIDLAEGRVVSSNERVPWWAFWRGR